MNQELYWIFAFNLIVNSLLSFFTTFCVAELFLFWVSNPRIHAVGSVLPFVKIVWDLFAYQFSEWALLQGINPLTAPVGTRQLSLMINPFTGIGFHMSEGQTFSPADVIALSVDRLWIQAIVCIAVLGMIFSCCALLLRRKKDVNAAFIPVPRSIHPALLALMKKRGVRLGFAAEIASPCIVGKHLLFPEMLWHALSIQERDAIIAHEMAHLAWQDGSVRFLCAIIAAVFWWIPSACVQRRIEKLQERACDAWIHRFSICKFALADAIIKTVKMSKGSSSKGFCSFAARPLTRRLQWMMREKPSASFALRTIQCGLAGIILLSILFGRMWIF